MRGMSVVADLHQPAPIVVEVVVSPVEVRAAIRVDVREVGVAVRIHPGGYVPNTISTTTR